MVEILSMYDSSSLESRTFSQWRSMSRSAPRQNPILPGSTQRRRTSCRTDSPGLSPGDFLCSLACHLCLVPEIGIGDLLRMAAFEEAELDIPASRPRPSLDAESLSVSCSAMTWFLSMPLRTAAPKRTASSSRYNTAPSATRSKYEFHRRLDFPARGGRRIKRTGAAGRRSILIEKRAVGEG
jgi:hypothetical protein